MLLKLHHRIAENTKRDGRTSEKLLIDTLYWPNPPTFTEPQVNLGRFLRRPVSICRSNLCDDVRLHNADTGGLGNDGPSSDRRRVFTANADFPQAVDHLTGS